MLARLGRESSLRPGPGVVWRVLRPRFGGTDGAAGSTDRMPFGGDTAESAAD